MTIITESQAARLPLAETGFLAAIARTFSAYRRSRRTLRELGAMDVHLLRDIGLTHADVMQALAADSPVERMALLNRARGRRDA